MGQAWLPAYCFWPLYLAPRRGFQNHWKLVDVRGEGHRFKMKIAVDVIASETDHSPELRTSCGPHILHVGARGMENPEVPLASVLCPPCFLRQHLSLA